jgi:hypothetical protein
MRRELGWSSCPAAVGQDGARSAAAWPSAPTGQGLLRSAPLTLSTAASRRQPVHGTAVDGLSGAIVPTMCVPPRRCCSAAEGRTIYLWSHDREHMGIVKLIRPSGRKHVYASLCDAVIMPGDDHAKATIVPLLSGGFHIIKSLVHPPEADRFIQS